MAELVGGLVAQYQREGGRSLHAIVSSAASSDVARLKRKLAELDARDDQINFAREFLEAHTDDNQNVECAVEAAATPERPTAVKLLMIAYLAKYDLINMMCSRPRDNRWEAWLAKRGLKNDPNGFKPDLDIIDAAEASLPLLGVLLQKNEGRGWSYCPYKEDEQLRLQPMQQSLGEEEDDKEDKEDKEDDDEQVLNRYAGLSHDDLALCVLFNFMLVPDWDYFSSANFTISDDNKLRVQDFGYAFLKVVRLVNSAEHTSRRKLALFETVEAATFSELSKRLQLALGTCLDYFGSNVTYMIFGAPSGCDRHEDGALGLSYCCVEGHSVLLAQPAMHAALSRIWTGGYLDELVRLLNEDGFPLAKLFSIVIFLVVVLCNIVLLPFLALLPTEWTLQRIMFPDVSENIYTKRRGICGVVNCVALTPRKCFLLQVAWFQAFIFHVFDLLLVIGLTLYLRTYPILLFIWSMAALGNEVSQVTSQTLRGVQDRGLARVLSQLKQYLAFDPFNLLDIPALFMVVCALALQLWDDLSSDRQINDPLVDQLPGLDLQNLPIPTAIQGLLERGKLSGWDENISALGLLIMWIRQLRLLTLLSPDTMSPLVLMVLAMLRDVFKFLCILIPVLFGFMAALTELFAKEAQGDHFPEECMWVMERLRSFDATFQVLFEGALLGEASMLECIHQSAHQKAGLTLMYAFLILTVLLLLNMIIAMMGRTFDAVFDAAKEQAATQFARTVLSWELEKGMPAPFNFLSLPLSLVGMLINLLQWVLSCCSSCLSFLNPFLHKELTDNTIMKEQTSNKLVTRVNNMLLEGEERMSKCKADKQEFGNQFYSPNEEPEVRQKVMDAYFGTIKEMADLRDKMEDALLARFGPWDSTNDLIKHAILVLSDRIDQLKTKSKWRALKK